MARPYLSFPGNKLGTPWDYLLYYVNQLEWAVTMKKFTVVAILIATGCAIAVRYAWLSHTSQTEAQLILADGNNHFSEVFETKKFVWPIDIINPTDKAIDIDRFVMSCGCTTITPQQLTIPAQSKAACQLTINLTLDQPKPGENGSERDVSFSILPVVAGKLQSRQGMWNVRGKVRRILELDHYTLDFGECQEQTQLTQTILVRAAVPLDGLVAKTDSLSWTAEAIKGDDRYQYTVTVRSSQAMPPGPINFRVHLTPLPARGGELSPNTVPCVGRVIPEYALYPQELLLGANTIGKLCQETVHLSSPDGKSFTVYSIRPNSQGLTVEQQGDNDSPRQKFLVRQTISERGRQHGTVTFDILTWDGRMRTTSLPIDYCGVQEIP